MLQHKRDNAHTSNNIQSTRKRDHFAALSLVTCSTELNLRLLSDKVESDDKQGVENEAYLSTDF